MKREKVVKICRDCGSDDITKEVRQRWCVESQAWLEAEAPDEAYCCGCGCEAGIEEVTVEELMMRGV